MAFYESREGEAGALNTAIELTTQGSVSAPGPLLVPKGTKSIKQIIAAVAVYTDTAADKVSVLLRLSGKGVKDSQAIPIAAGVAGAGTLAGGGDKSYHPFVLDCDIPVNEGSAMNIIIEANGSDVALVHANIGLVFV